MLSGERLVLLYVYRDGRWVAQPAAVGAPPRSSPAGMCHVERSISAHRLRHGFATTRSLVPVSFARRIGHPIGGSSHFRADGTRLRLGVAGRGPGGLAGRLIDPALAARNLRHTHDQRKGSAWMPSPCSRPTTTR